MPLGARCPAFLLSSIVLMLVLPDPVPLRAQGHDTPTADQIAPGQAPQQTVPGPPSGWAFSVQNLTRVEVWRFFDPPPTGGDPDYTFAGNRLRLTAQYGWTRGQLVAAAQYTQLSHLPEGAFGPGALGTGALYFDHARERSPGQLHAKLLFARFGLGRGLTIQAGRFGYASGAESSSGLAKVEAVKRLRITSRMIGEFEWSLFQRSFDGARVDLDRVSWQLTGGVFWPTQGGFEPVAGPTMQDVGVGAFTVTLRPDTLLPATDLAAFVYRYDDTRAVRARPDNTGLQVPRVDVGITTFGASVVGSTAVGGGELDWLAWGAGQTGSWYGQDHRAWTVALEGGYQWTSARWRPWARAGYLHASGDDDPRDASHKTFFQMLPTVRKYAYTASYAQMNLRDVFVEIVVQPSPSLRFRGDLRRLWLANRADRWYAGSGATRSRGTFFGFAARPSGGHTDFGSVVEGAADITLSRHWSVNAFLGTIRGGRVVRASFPGRWLTFVYLENVVSF